MANFFDQFDATPTGQSSQKSANFFDQFDAPAQSSAPPAAQTGSLPEINLPGIGKPSLIGMAKGLFEGAKSAITLPSDVYAGKVNPLSDEGIKRTADLASMTMLPSAGRTAAFRAAEVPSNEAILNKATDTYKELRSGNIAKPIPQSALDNLVSEIKADVARNGPDVDLAPTAHSMIDKISQSEGRQAPLTQTNTELAGPGFHIAEDIVKPQADIADLVTKRQNLKSLFENPLPDPNKAVAAIAIPKIDAAIGRLSPGTIEELRAADANYSAAKTSQGLDKKINRAELRAAGADSGMNLGNKIRQKAADMLLSDKESRGLTQANRDALEQVVRGTATQNTLRKLGNALGGGMGLGSTLLSSGAALAGHPYLALAPLAGVGVRTLGNRSTMGQIQNVGAAIRARSPYAQQQMRAAPSGIIQMPQLNLPPPSVGLLPYANRPANPYQ